MGEWAYTLLSFIDRIYKMTERKDLTTLEMLLETYNKEVKRINEREDVGQVDKVQYMLENTCLFLTFIIESQERPLTYFTLMHTTVKRMMDEKRMTEGLIKAKEN